MDITKAEQWIEAFKHLQGQHNQKLHGNRGAKISEGVNRPAQEYSGAEGYGFSKQFKVDRVLPNGVTKFSDPRGGGMYGNAAAMVKMGAHAGGGMVASKRGQSTNTATFQLVQQHAHAKPTYTLTHYQTTAGGKAKKTKTEKFANVQDAVKRLNEVSSEWTATAEG